MPYGISDAAWKALEPELKEAIKAKWERDHAPQPPERPKPPSTPAPPPQPIPGTPKPAPAPKPPVAGTDNWFFVRRRQEYPGNHPDYTVLHNIGITGILTEVDDPLLQEGLSMDQSAGFLAGVWIDPGKYGTPQAAADHMKDKLKGHRIDKIALDPETGNVAKGMPGSPEWSYSVVLATVMAGAFPGVPIIVTPIPNQDDFNYAAYLASGQDVWVQTYGSDVTQLFDPVSVVRRVMANGVPVSRIGALISPLQIQTAPGALASVGVTKISVYTSDHWPPGVGGTPSPFPGSPTPTPHPDQPQPPPPSPSPTPTPPKPYPLPEPEPPPPPVDPDEPEPDDDPDIDEGDPVESEGDDPPDDLGDTSADLSPYIFVDGERHFESIERLAPSPYRGPHPPVSVVQAVSDDILGHKVPPNIAVGLRMAMLIVQKGIPYVWGGTDPNRGLDCSGFALVVYRAAGWKTLPRVTYDQAKKGRAVSPQHRQALDLCFFHPTSRGPGHVAIYMAGGWAVHEPHTGEVAQWLDISAGYKPLFTRRYFKDIKGYTPTPDLPPGPPAPKVPGLEHAYDLYADAISESVPKSVNRIGNARAKIHDLLR